LVPVAERADTLLVVASRRTSGVVVPASEAWRRWPVSSKHLVWCSDFGDGIATVVVEPVVPVGTVGIVVDTVG
jgi:hypothetical protein